MSSYALARVGLGLAICVVRFSSFTKAGAGLFMAGAGAVAVRCIGWTSAIAFVGSKTKLVPLLLFGCFAPELGFHLRLVLTVETTLCNSEDAEGLTAEACLSK